MHSGRVEPDEERTLVGDGFVDELGRRVIDLEVDRRHPITTQRAGILDPLPAVAVRPRVDDAARPKLTPEFRVARIVVRVRLFLRVEVVKVTKELVKAVHGRKMLVAIAKMVLAKLAGGIAERLQQVGYSRRPIWYPLRRAGHADRQHPCPERMLT